ncbi:hypothetical protein C8J56DRAFT_897244 [Mycena floridula]|nr:hypothetical protein C8J56DRAFT_897244 [Mycena floridula]
MSGSRQSAATRSRCKHEFPLDVRRAGGAKVIWLLITFFTEFHSGPDHSLPSYTHFSVFLGHWIPTVIDMLLMLVELGGRARLGESPIIVNIRACILLMACLAIPAFGIYTIVIAPINSQVMQRNIYLPAPQDYEIIAFAGVYNYSTNMENVTITLYNDNKYRSDLTVQTMQSGQVNCANGWSDDILFTANFTETSRILYLTPGAGSSSDVRRYGTPIPLMWGSHLAAVLSSTQRQIFSISAVDLLGFTTPMRSFSTYDVLSMQTDPNPPNSGSDTVSIRLRFREDTHGNPTKILQDYTDASVLGGFAIFGGFWTFVNGAFAMFFGANLLYFLFRRRPLSALGIIHIFQRKTLVQQWNEDFPALHTEGGHPGSNSAGIVAFVRERLVDLDDVESETDETDIEAQNQSSQIEYHAMSVAETQEGTNRR